MSPLIQVSFLDNLSDFELMKVKMPFSLNFFMNGIEEKYGYSEIIVTSGSLITSSTHIRSV